MKLSRLLTSNSFNAQSDMDVATQWLLRAGWIHQASAGVYNYLTLGTLALTRLENALRQQMLQLGFDEVRLTVLQTKHLWDTTGRWEQYGDNLYHVGKDACLAATHEEMITSLAAELNLSHAADVFQFGNKYRYEARAKGGLIRGRDFIMKDAYSFRRTQAEIAEVYDHVLQAYTHFFTSLGLELHVREADTGEIGGLRSHEFLVACELGEDVINGKRYLELGHIFNLGTKYSTAFNLTHQGQLMEMACYGIGISRLLAAYIHTHLKGHMLTTHQHLHSATLYLVVDKAHHALAQEVYHALRQTGISVLWDDSELSMGRQLTQSELVGARYRLCLTKRGAETGYELKCLATGTAMHLKRSDLLTHLASLKT